MSNYFRPLLWREFFSFNQETRMAGPLYLFLKDEDGVDIAGSSNVIGRVGAIEAFSFAHNLYAPTDGSTGKLTGQCQHQELVIEKEIDRSTPFLYRAIQTGRTLQEAKLKWYRVDEGGQEYEYFNTIMAGVKIVSITPRVPNPKVAESPHQTHTELVSFRYSSITWLYHDGNIRFTAP
jgi:type VI secretion system secreted protein Hcp